MSFDIGTYYQLGIHSSEWRAAMVVYQKYRRKFGLDHKDLISLTQFTVRISDESALIGKQLSQDHLIQLASAELKKWKHETVKSES